MFTSWLQKAFFFIFFFYKTPMVLSQLTPVPKDNNDMQYSDKLHTIFAKLFEFIILSVYIQELQEYCWEQKLAVWDRP